MIVSVKEMKNYLRVDFEDDDRFLADLIEQGQQICMDVARMNERVVFQKCSVVKERIGNHRNEWADDYCCFATIGGEGLASSKETENAGTVVDAAGIFYNKSEVWIQSERLYEVLFSFMMEG